MKRISLSLLLICIFFPASLQAGELKPGFVKDEYLELLSFSAWHGDTAYYPEIPRSAKFRSVYRSGSIGLDNRWEMAITGDGSAAICIKGTTGTLVSWLGNYYSAMVPAKGSLDLQHDFKFEYDLADNPKAAVHIGWLIGTAYLSREIIPKIDSCYKAGIHSFYIYGHSQGGAIAYLMTSCLLRMQKNGMLPAGMQFKTYCSAAPKPGNLFYAYDFENATAGGWAFNVVNQADWVPETPLAVQTINDLNTTNPFVNAKTSFKKLKLTQRLALNYIFNRLNTPSQKAQRRYERYLGKRISKYIKRTLKEFNPPIYFHSDNYARAGTFIILVPHNDYYKLFQDSKEDVFIHHRLLPYYYLARELPSD
jgi:hypothetical protein